MSEQTGSAAQPPTPATSPSAPASRGHSSATLARSSALMASGTFVSRILGLVRVMLLAGAVGLLSPSGNAWQTANTLPNTIYILLAGGVLNVVLVPSLTRAMSRADGGRDFTDRLITLMLLCLAGIAVVFTAGAALLTKFYALTWTGDQLALAVTFAYLCLPQIFFYGLYTMLGQILNAHEKFGWFMWAPVANNIVAIGGLLVFLARYPDAQELGPGDWTAPMIWLLAGTATLGVMVQALVLLVPVWRSGFRWRPRWGFRGVGLGAASRMALWMLAVIGVSQTGMWLSTNVLNRASTLDGGAPGKLIYENAFLFYILPHSLIATSLITAMFTQLSRSAHAGDLPALGEQYRHGLRLLGAAMIPISIAMLVLAPALTRVLLFRNTPEETLATAWVTMAMVVGLAPYAVYILSGRIFHAFQDGATPFRMQVGITAVSVAGTLVAASMPAGRTAVGVALAQTGGQFLAAVLGLLWVRRRLGGLALHDVRQTWQRVAAATAVAAVPTVGVVLLSRALLDGYLAAVVMLLVGGVVFFTTYAVLAHRFGVRELAEAAEPIARRLRRGRRPVPARAPAASPPPQPDASSTPAEPAALGDGASEPLGERTAWSATPGAASGLAWGHTPGGVGPQVSMPVQTPPDQQVEPWAVDPPDRQERRVQGIEAGTHLGGRYALEELLAQRGETLDYWSARDTTLDRLVAVTVLPSHGEHAEAAQAVLDGARRVAGVDDPRLVRVLDVGEDDGRSWIIEEGLLEAESLASLVVEHPLPAEEARRIVGETAAALESARRRGLHHLFLNPHAVLRTREGNVKISGVAVAAAIEQTEELPPAEATLIDTVDLVSLLYTALTGRWPGEEMEGLRSARRLADGTLPAPSEVAGGVPGDLDAICRMTLAADYDPSRGPRTPGELAQQLSPWSAEIVRAEPGAVIAPPAADRGPSASAALAGAAGASAAATAAHPFDREADAAGPPVPRGSDRSAQSGRGERPGGGAEEPYFRTAGAAAGGAGAGMLAGRDDDRLDAMPDRSLPPGVRGREGPSRLTTGLVLLIIAAVVATGVFLAFRAFRGVDSADSTASRSLPTDTATATAPADTTEETSSPTDTAPPEGGEALTIAGITSYDPEGDGDERNDIVDRAIDGDPETAWNSHTYSTDGFGGLKSGVGLAVDLGESVEVSQIELVFPRGDYGTQVWVNDEPTLDGATRVGAWRSAKNTWQVTPDEPATGRYVIVWFIRAWDGPKGEIVYLSEITVR